MKNLYYLKRNIEYRLLEFYELLKFKIYSDVQ